MIDSTNERFQIYITKYNGNKIQRGWIDKVHTVPEAAGVVLLDETELAIKDKQTYSHKIVYQMFRKFPNCIRIFVYKKCETSFIVVCFIYLFMYIIIVFYILGTMLVVFFMPLVSFFLNSYLFNFVLIILTLQNKWIELNWIKCSYGKLQSFELVQTNDRQRVNTNQMGSIFTIHDCEQHFEIVDNICL